MGSCGDYGGAVLESKARPSLGFDQAVQYLWIESLSYREGSSLLPLIQDPDMTDWKEAVFWQYARRGWQADTPNPVPRKMGELILIMCSDLRPRHSGRILRADPALPLHRVGDGHRHGGRRLAAGLGGQVALLCIIHIDCAQRAGRRPSCTTWCPTRRRTGTLQRRRSCRRPCSHSAPLSMPAGGKLCRSQLPDFTIMNKLFTFAAIELFLVQKFVLCKIYFIHRMNEEQTRKILYWREHRSSRTGGGRCL